MEFPYPNFLPEQFLIRPKDHGVVPGTNLGDIVLVGQVETQAPVLADGVADDALMLAQNVALGIHEIPRLRLFAGPQLDDPCVIPVGDEADVLRIRLIGVDEAAFLGDLPGLLLAQFP